MNPEPPPAAPSVSCASRPPATPLVALTPVAATERIEVVDVLRGVAIFGILCVNMFWFSNPFMLMMGTPSQWTASHDRFAQWLIRLFCEQKFYSLFSLLFGFGMAILMTRVEGRGGSFVRLYVRRLLFLLLIGICHVVWLWPGDILIVYALIGFVLLLFRHCRPGTLLAWAIALHVVPSLLICGLTVLGKLGEAFANAVPTTGPAPQDPAAEMTATFARWAAAGYETYAHGSFGAILLQRLADYALAFLFTSIFAGPCILGMFLLGLYAAGRGVLHQPAAHAGFLRRLVLVCLPIGLVANLVITICFELAPRSEVSWLAIPAAIVNIFGPALLCFAYAAGLVLLSQHGQWARRLHPLASVGRMALTNYLLQSLICTLIFNSYGLGLYGQVGPAAGLGLTVAIFALQIPLSMWWLRRFRFGPAEWLWRSVTYGHAQPLKVTR